MELNYTIRNDLLTVVVSDTGAELQSVMGCDGWEWLWQGDPDAWERRAPILFPFCGRTWRGLSTVYGVPCNPGLHGFFQSQKTAVEEICENKVTLVQTESPETLSRYPFPYEVRVCYVLEGDWLTVQTVVRNTGTRMMPYGFGAHPGFRLLSVDGVEHHSIQFSDRSGADAINFDDAQCYPVGGFHSVTLRDGDKFDLSDHAVAKKACFFCNMPPEATLMSDLSVRRVTIRYDGFSYLGIWKAPGAEFVCMEPWCSLPGICGANTELTEREDFFRLKPGETGMHTFSIRFWKTEN